MKTVEDRLETVEGRLCIVEGNINSLYSLFMAEGQKMWEIMFEAAKKMGEEEEDEEGTPQWLI